MSKSKRDGRALANVFIDILTEGRRTNDYNTAFRDCLLIHQIIDNFHDFGPITRSEISRDGQARPTQPKNLKIVYDTYVAAGYHEVTHPRTRKSVSISELLGEKDVDLLRIDVNFKDFKQGFLKQWTDSKRSVYYNGPDTYDHLKSSSSSLTVERPYVQDVKFLKGQFPIGKASKTLAGIIDPSPMTLVPGGNKKKPIMEGGGRDFVLHITKDKLLLPPLGFEITSSGTYDSDKTTSSFKHASCVTSKEMHIGYMLIKVQEKDYPDVFKSVGAVYKYYYDNESANVKPELNCLLNISNNRVSKALLLSGDNTYQLWSITLYRSKVDKGDRLYEWSAAPNTTQPDGAPRRQWRTGENLLRMVKNMFVGAKVQKYGQYKSLLVQYEHDNDGPRKVDGKRVNGPLRKTNCIVCYESKIFSVKHLTIYPLFKGGNPLTKLRILEAKYGGDFSWLVNLMMSNKHRGGGGNHRRSGRFLGNNTSVVI